MAEIARASSASRSACSHEMGMHTERLSGRSQQEFFDIDLSEARTASRCPNAFDVDFNKRAEIDAGELDDRSRSICASAS